MCISVPRPGGTGGPWTGRFPPGAPRSGRSNAGCPPAGPPAASPCVGSTGAVSSALQTGGARAHLPSHAVGGDGDVAIWALAGTWFSHPPGSSVALGAVRETIRSLGFRLQNGDNAAWNMVVEERLWDLVGWRYRSQSWEAILSLVSVKSRWPQDAAALPAENRNSISLGPGNVSASVRTGSLEQNLCDGLISTLQMKKVRRRGGKKLSQLGTPSKWPLWDLEPGDLTPRDSRP